MSIKSILMIGLSFEVIKKNTQINNTNNIQINLGVSAKSNIVGEKMILESKIPNRKTDIIVNLNFIKWIKQK